MATDESGVADERSLTLRGAAGPAVGAVAAWIALDLLLSSGAWPVGSALAAISFLPALGVGIRRRATALAVVLACAAGLLVGVALYRGIAVSGDFLVFAALIGPFLVAKLVGLGYVLADPAPGPR